VRLTRPQREDGSGAHDEHKDREDNLHVNWHSLC